MRCGQGAESQVSILRQRNKVLMLPKSRTERRLTEVVEIHSWSSVAEVELLEYEFCGFRWRLAANVNELIKTIFNISPKNC